MQLNIYNLGQQVNITARFVSGNVTFTWTSNNVTYYDVQIIRNEQTDESWTNVYDTQYKFIDVLLFKSIGINVRLPGSGENNNFTYKGMFGFYYFIYCFRSKYSSWLLAHFIGNSNSKNPKTDYRYLKKKFAQIISSIDMFL